VATSDNKDTLADERAQSLARIALAESELSGAFSYWRKLEKDHYFNAVLWAIAFIVVFVVARIAGVILLYGSPKFLEVDSSLPNVNLAIARAISHILLFGTIVGFFIWGLRQVVRLWAYHEDLYRQAREKAAMLHTFAALRGAGWLTPEDVNVVVRAVFRVITLSARTGTDAPATPYETVVKQIGEAIKGERKAGRE
jgi:Family of unknown function (DUF6161)